MGSPHTPTITADLLRAYSDAALRNADDLLVEALLLRDHGHMARAYFLAVACIEEAGKALQAFDAQNWNLSDPAVCTRLKTGMENHEQKVIYALGTWALNDADQSVALKAALDLISQLKRGREPSMYSDLRTSPDRAQTPRDVVRPKATRDCIMLAEHCLAHAHHYISEKTPAKVTASQDRLFTMKPAKFQEMLSTEDFWWYFIARMNAGQEDIADAVLGYEREHIKTGISFRRAEANDD